MTPEESHVYRKNASLIRSTPAGSNNYQLGAGTAQSIERQRYDNGKTALPDLQFNVV